MREALRADEQHEMATRVGQEMRVMGRRGHETKWRRRRRRGDTVRHTPLPTRRQQRRTHATSTRTAKEIITAVDEWKRTKQNVHEVEQMEATESTIMRVVQGARTKRNEFSQQTTDEDCSVIFSRNAHAAAQSSARTVAGRWLDSANTHGGEN